MADKYVTFKPDGTLNLRLIKGLHVIPEGAIQVDEKLWLRLIQETDGIWVLGKGGTIKKVMPNPPTAEEDRAATAALIASVRYEQEVRGIFFREMPVDTDDRSKSLIAVAALKAIRTPDYVLNWKTSSGFVELDAAQVLEMADAVTEHVQACFDREAALLVALADGSFGEAMLREGWPA